MSSKLGLTTAIALGAVLQVFWFEWIMASVSVDRIQSELDDCSLSCSDGG